MINIKTYNEYREYMSAFKMKKLNLLTVVSRGGLGKTFIAEDELMMEAPLVCTGHVTPMALYKALYERTKEEKDVIVIFDDVDGLMQNKTNVALLKQICDTRETKTVKYFTSSGMLADVPREFETNCKVLMLMNDVSPEDNNLRALMTRSHLVNFVPDDIEILDNMKTFGKDKEILEFIGVYAPFSTALNLRCYVRAAELKASGLDWKLSIVNDLKVDARLLEIHKLLKKYKTHPEREKHFSESRATYYRTLKTLLSKNPQLEALTK